MGEPMMRSDLTIVDGAELMTRLDNDAGLLQELVAMFQEQSAELLNDIKGAILQGDAKKLQFSAHTLKGSAGTFCAPMTCEAAQILEDMGMNADFTHAAIALAQLEFALQQMIQSLCALSATFPS